MSYVVEMSTGIYGPFATSAEALQFANQSFPHRNPLHDPVRPLMQGRVLSPGEMQEKACFPNGR